MSTLLKHDRRLVQRSALEIRSLDIPLDGGDRRKRRSRVGLAVAGGVVCAALAVVALGYAFAGDEQTAPCDAVRAAQQRGSIITYIREAAGVRDPGCARQGAR